MNSSRQIHVALAFDNNYWAPAYTVMRSICFHSREHQQLEFHLCEYDVSASHRADLDRISEEFGAKLHHYDVLQLDSFRQAEAILPVKGNLLHAVTYARMVLDHFVPKTLKRIIYLDCDTMVATPIEDLFDLDLNGHALGAVFDTQSMKGKMGYDIKGKADIFKPTDDYFNAGVLVIDLDKYRQAGILARMREFETSGIVNRLYYDQDMLNLIFRGDWHKLHWRYNVIDPRPPHEALQPKILHFTGGRKPWKLFSGVAFASTYRHMMTQSLFYRFWRFRLKRRLSAPFRKLGKVFRPPAKSSRQAEKAL